MIINTDDTLPIPDKIQEGIEAILEIGPEIFNKLIDWEKSAVLKFPLSDIISPLARDLGCEYSILETAFQDALIPLNGIRRSLGIAANDFVAILSRSLDKDGWEKDDQEKWERVSEQLSVFFQPNNFFALASKAFELLSQRPTVFKQCKILNELRPIFDEEHSKTLALLQTCTLVLRYWDDNEECALHVTLDAEDLDSLVDEIEEAKKKIKVSQQEARISNINLLTYGA